MYEPQNPWETVYANKKPDEVSWYQTHLEKSLELIRRTGAIKTIRIIDLGGGASTLVDDLLASGFKEVTVDTSIAVTTSSPWVGSLG